MSSNKTMLLGPCHNCSASRNMGSESFEAFSFHRRMAEAEENMLSFATAQTVIIGIRVAEQFLEYSEEGERKKEEGCPTTTPLSRKKSEGKSTEWLTVTRYQNETDHTTNFRYANITSQSEST
ncbi:hypothetical protein M0802_000092 [Mischocyttarus mexicanus]|nr:hypothetical protein M0802_000092 [Mischocyttarus mexicanus]